MLREVQELQEEAVEGILKALERQDEVTFKAPTGSGKTHMMADLMNRVLSEDPRAVFLISTLSKGGLAEQNFEKFKEYGKEFPKLSPCLVSSEDFVEEARPFIPSGYNVYVLGRDSYKQKNSRLTHVFPAFLKSELQDGKNLYLIKDECHQATNNLDQLSSYFFKKINFSATPKQAPDVSLKQEDAVNCHLIKEVDWRQEESELKEGLEEALKKLEKVKQEYAEQFKSDPGFGKRLRPCLIIQISNKDKAEKELEEIKEVLGEHPLLLWALVVDKDKDCETNNEALRKLPPSQWGADLKKNDSLASVDVIIFKMVITEGWDIPRACMLFQVRETDSKILDEQVLGRVRRNPKLLNFEDLDEKSQELVTQAWVWGLKPHTEKEKRKVRLTDSEAVQRHFRLKVTSLPDAKKLSSSFNLKELVKEKPDFEEAQSIFSFYAALKKAPEPVKDLKKDFVKSVSEWYEFCYHLPSIKKKTKEAIDNTSNLRVEEREVTFPKETYYLETPGQEREKIQNWIWEREDEDKRFSFDSQAEYDWFNKLQDFVEDGEVQAVKSSTLFGRNRDELIPLLGKNFLKNSHIAYAYTMEGEKVLHSYPDFVMEGKDGTLYLFEVKSLEEAGSTQNILDPEAYKKKVEALKRWYKAASQRLKGYVFCVPVRNEGEWKVYAYKDGEALGGEGGYMAWRKFRGFVREQNREN